MRCTEASFPASLNNEIKVDKGHHSAYNINTKALDRFLAVSPHK